MAEYTSSDPEKGLDIAEKPALADANPRKSSVADSIAADLFDERYETTHRGLKSRHAQMIALGGTIGTG